MHRQRARAVVNPNEPATARLPAWVDRYLPTFARQYRASRFYRALSWLILLLLPVVVLLAGWIEWQKFRFDPRRHQASNQVTLLITERCPLSRELQAALDAAGIAYRRLDVERSGEGEWAYYSVRARGVPVTVVGADVVYGLRTNALRQTLARGGIDTARLRFARDTDGDVSPVMRSGPL